MENVEPVSSLDGGLGTQSTQLPDSQLVLDTSRVDIIVSGNISGFPDVYGLDIATIRRYMHHWQNLGSFTCSVLYEVHSG